LQLVLRNEDEHFSSFLCLCCQILDYSFLGGAPLFANILLQVSGPAGFELARPRGRLLTVNNSIKLQVDLQADKSPVVVKEPFFPRVVNPRYRIRGT
jgi:hypothetical protein